MSPTPSDEVLISVEGAVGRLRLNRPKAIHALTHGMCAAMGEALREWREHPEIELVLIDHLPSPDGDPKLSRGFCAGGDIRMIWESARADGVAARAFFHEEYRLNHLLFTYAKPVIAFLDGIVMGGGVGISLPAKHRIATERTVFAMPETGIGLFPDVGAGWYLSRLPGRTGAYLAATGARIDGADCVALGLATHYVPSDRLEALKAALIAKPRDAKALLDAAASPPPPTKIAAQHAEIDRLFASDRYEDILAALEQDGGDFATATLKALAAKSPQTIKVSLRLVAQGALRTDFADEMRVEYALATHVCQRNDFLEGVRALIVDKTNDPRWSPATPEDVTDGLIDTIFAPLPEGEAWTPYRL